ncbi:hypothetical protein [Flavobacterium sp.]|uniref:hypothetical protein n=1 Tax=Flavobacterium sp. TaxID=239 RepID=UPI0012047766|nr:hypothetical protein [Flavobacterium sp.]RZJ69231.1 MAG: hypothetical protein EOO49_18205 [Flavobacterium sp.]
MYDYTFEYFGEPKDITDEYIDKQIAIAQSNLIQNLEITLDDIGRRTQTPNVNYDGKSGTRIEYLISQYERKLQWLTIFYDSDRSYLKITSDVYLGQD